MSDISHLLDAAAAGDRRAAADLLPLVYAELRALAAARMAAEAEAMRRILVDGARRKRAAKHGGGWDRRDAEIAIVAPEPPEDLLALDEALGRFAALEPAKAELVKLRYFAGLTIEEAAAALAISPATAKRHWAYSRAWLFRSISGEGTEDP